MIGYLHTKTVVHSLDSIKTLDGVTILDAAFSMLSEEDQQTWKSIINDIFFQIEEDYGLEPSHVKNAEYLLHKLDLEIKSDRLYAWQLLELDRLYTRHISKLNKIELNKADYQNFREKAEQEISEGFTPTLANELNLVLKNRLDSYALKHDQKEQLGKQFSYKRFLQSQKTPFELDCVELTIAIDSVIDILDENHQEEDRVISLLLKNAKHMLLYVKANINPDHPFGRKDYYWALMSIKLMSIIKMYFIDPDTNKKTFFGNGYRQDHLNNLLEKMLTTTPKAEIEKLSIDEKLEHAYANIADLLNIHGAEDTRSSVVKSDDVNFKYVALIILNCMNKEVHDLNPIWADELNALYQSLYDKYMTHTLRRAENITKVIATPPSPRFYHKYMDDCLECHQVN